MFKDKAPDTAASGPWHSAHAQSDSAAIDTSGHTSITEIVSAAQAARLAATLGVHDANDPTPEMLPWGWHTVFCNTILNAHDLAVDGLPRHDPVLPEHPGFPYRLFGGTRQRFLKPVPVGTMLRCDSRIERVTPKTGRSGPMLVLEIERQFMLGDEVAVMEQQSVIYKQDATTQASTTAAETGSEALAGPGTEPAAISELDVFRFSALTFNSHRIHYDAPYTQGMEGKPGLLIQAKLTALHLLRFSLAKCGARTPVSFEYRALRPFYCPDTLHMSAKQGTTIGSLDVWGTDTRGAVVMQAGLVY
ncbi:MAG: hypothetical protein V4454_15630 [Pseudomonadota bacterium]